MDNVSPIGRRWHASESPTAVDDVRRHLASLRAFRESRTDSPRPSAVSTPGSGAIAGRLRGETIPDDAFAINPAWSRRLLRIFTAAAVVAALSAVTVVALACVGAGYLAGMLR